MSEHRKPRELVLYFTPIYNILIQNWFLEPTEKLLAAITEADADWWINYNIEDTKNQGGRSVNWAIRRSDNDYLVGCIGYHRHVIGSSHRAELGYWLAKPLWNKGIMTAAVKKATEYGFSEFSLTRITAHVFAFNTASAKVLEKAGYQYEGYLRGHYKKDGQVLDGKLYAILRDDVAKQVQQNALVKPKGTE